MINTREVKVVDGFHGNRNLMYFGFPVSQPRVLHNFWVHYVFLGQETISSCLSISFRGRSTEIYPAQNYR